MSKKNNCEKTGTCPKLGRKICENCTLHIDLELLKNSFRNGGIASMELVFYPLDGSREAFHDTLGRGAFQFGSNTPLVWTCTFGEFVRVVGEHGFKPYTEDRLAFRNPLLAAVMEG